MNFLGLSLTIFSQFSIQNGLTSSDEGAFSFTTVPENELFETVATSEWPTDYSDFNQTVADDSHTAINRKLRFQHSWKSRPPSGGYPKPEFQPPPFHASIYEHQHQTNAFVQKNVNITKVENMVAECFNNYMKIELRLNGSFSGLVYSTGYAHDPDCVYVNGTGRSNYEFYVRLNTCGTLAQSESRQRLGIPGETSDLNRNQYMWNSLTVQYNSLIEEDIDEHLRVTCEFGYDYWKTVTFPAFQIEVNTDNPVSFTLNPPQCNMEMRMGYGTAGTRIAGPVTVGDPLTLLVQMKSPNNGFDILVSNCVAHNGANKKLQLIDNNGCVTSEKLLSNFRGYTSSDNGHQVTLYAFLKAFRFTGSPALYLECDIQMCRGTCPAQHCYWRRLKKRSSEDNPVVSESLNLVHTLEVRHAQDVTIHGGSSSVESVCLKTSGFATLVTLLLIVLVFLSLLCACLCWRIRYLKRADELLTKKSQKSFHF